MLKGCVIDFFLPGVPASRVLRKGMIYMITYVDTCCIYVYIWNMYVCICFSVYIRKWHAWSIYVYTWCIHVYIYKCIYVCTYIYIYIHKWCIHVYIYKCIYVGTYIYIYIHIYGVELNYLVSVLIFTLSRGAAASCSEKSSYLFKFLFLVCYLYFVLVEIIKNSRYLRVRDS